MKIFVDTIGCRLNQSEIEKIAAQFRSAGHVMVDSAAEADLALVNTCAVTAEAASDSRQKIRQAHRAGAGEIIVTGCWSTLDPEAAAGLAGVRWVIPNEAKRDLVRQVLDLPNELMDLEPLERQPLPGLHLRTRAFIKTQDGCDNYCTYCITRVARGSARSQTLKEVLGDIRLALAGGAREVVLTGVHLGSWGQDFEEQLHLADLIREILDQTDVERLRLSSLEPWDLTPEFFSLWQDRRLCRHLHLPLQAGSLATLRRMARKTTPDSFSRLVELAHQADVDMAVTTDVIVGFPGETDQDFEDSLEFVRRMNFAAGHVFNFSPRPGTPAAHYADQVSPTKRKTRSATMRALLEESAAAYRRRFIGRQLDVLWEAASVYGPRGWQLEGLTDNYLRVTATSTQRRWNQIDLVDLCQEQNGLLSGEIIPIPAP